MLKEFISFVKPWSFCLTKSGIHFFCEAMELLPDGELQMSASGGANSFQDIRAKKIALFTRQKAAESKLLEINERKEGRSRSTRAAAISTPVETGEEDVLDDDGEEEREAWLTTISLALCKEGDKEVSQAILDERAKKAEAWHRDADARARFSKSAAPITCVTFAQDVIEGRKEVSDTHEHKHQPIIFGPASLMVMGKNPTSERERLAAQVFQPQYGLPTISIEEAGLREMEMMNKWQERNAKLMEEANSSWYKDNQMLRPDEEEDDDDEAAQDWARQWDDWKDDNPRGPGNKKLTPCG